MEKEGSLFEEKKSAVALDNSAINRIIFSRLGAEGAKELEAINGNPALLLPDDIREILNKMPREKATFMLNFLADRIYWLYFKEEETKKQKRLIKEKVDKYREREKDASELMKNLWEDQADLEERELESSIQPLMIEEIKNDIRSKYEAGKSSVSDIADVDSAKPLNLDEPVYDKLNQYIRTAVDNLLGNYIKGDPISQEYLHEYYKNKYLAPDLKTVLGESEFPSKEFFARWLLYKSKGMPCIIKRYVPKIEKRD